MALRRQKDVNKLARTQALAGYSPLALTLVAGFLAGTLVAFLPLMVLGLNTLLQWILGILHGTGADWGIQSAARLLRRSIVPLLWTAFGMGLYGMVLSILRRISIQREIYFGTGDKHRIDFQMGLNTLVALVVTPIILIILFNAMGAGVLLLWMGLGAIALGPAFDMIWEAFHTKVLDLFTDPDPGTERALEIRELLRIDESLGQFTARSIAVDWERRAVHVEGDYDHPLMEKRVRELILGRVVGVKQVYVTRLAAQAAKSQPGEATEAAGAASPRPGALPPDFRPQFRVWARSRLGKTA